MNVVMISPGYPAEMAYFTRALAAVGATVIGVGDQPPSALPAAARGMRSRTTSRCSLADEGAVLAALHGLARHASIDQVECLWEPYMILAARIREAFGLPGHDGRADGAVPRQGADEAGARRRRHPHAAARQRDDRGRGVGGGGADRLPAHRQADRRRRLGRHLPGRLRRGAGRGPAAAAARARGQRRGVRRRRGVHLRHRLRRRRDPVREHRVVPAAPAADAKSHEWISPVVHRAARPAPCRTCRAAGRWAARCWRRSASGPASPTWSGTARPTARWCSARSARGRRAPERST